MPLPDPPVGTDAAAAPQTDTRQRRGPARSLVIPMKDETARLPRSLAALAGSPHHRPDTELILVDDGSVDGTAELAERLLDELGLEGEVVRLGTNMGKGAAVRAGMALARGHALAFSDADLSAPPRAIDACFALIESGRADVVLTTRLHDESTITALPPLTRRLGGKVFNTLIRGLGLTTFADTQCGLKGFSDKAAALVFRELVVHRFAFDVEVLARAERAGFRIVELPIEWAHAEASQVSPLRDGLKMAVDVLRVRAALGRRGSELADASGEPRGGAGTMPEHRFEGMARVEDDHWWFSGKRGLVLATLADQGISSGAALDVGCGTGGVVRALEGAGLDPVVGIDRSPAALALASAGGARCLASASAAMLPIADAAVRCITSLDVIEHLDDDVAALREYVRVVEPGGLVLVAVPAYQWAWSDHDTALGHRRRYTARRLEDAAVAAGLDVLRTTYFHSWLVPVAAALRKTPLRRLGGGSSAEEASYVGRRVNRALSGVVAMEQRLARRARVPFGLSILLVARRPIAASTGDR